MAAGGAASSSAIFRIIAAWKGTLVIDEADFKDSEMQADIMKILNQGYEQGDYVLRSEKGGADDNFAVQGFDVYGPKVLGTRKRFSDVALENRCLSKHFEKKSVADIDKGRTAENRVPFALDPEFYARAQAIRNKLLRWRFRRYQHIVVDPRQRIEGLVDPRLVQISIALLAAADSEEMRAEVLKYIQAHQNQLVELREASLEAQVARALVDRWKQVATRDQGRGDQGQIILKEIVEPVSKENGRGRWATDDHHAPEWMPAPNFSSQVAAILRDTFGFHVKASHGPARVHYTKSQIKKIAATYDIPLVNRQPVTG